MGGDGWTEFPRVHRTALQAFRLVFDLRSGMIPIMNDAPINLHPHGREASDPDPRLVRLESHVTELERLVDELNRVIIEHGKTLRRLVSQNRELSSALNAFEMDRIRSTPSKPPHSVI